MRLSNKLFNFEPILRITRMEPSLLVNIFMCVKLESLEVAVVHWGFEWCWRLPISWSINLSILSIALFFADVWKFLEAEEEINAKKSKGLWLKIRYKENKGSSFNSKMKEDKRIDPPKESFEEPKYLIVHVGRNFEDKETIILEARKNELQWTVR